MSRTPHQVTPETAAQVEALAGYGVRQDEIAAYLGIDPKTLRKHYREQLDKGEIRANVDVARALHKQATEGNVTAAIFWLKARAGWRDRPQQVVVDVDEDGSSSMVTRIELVPLHERRAD